MTDSKRCKSCGNPVDVEQAKAHDGACPWCLAAFTFGSEPTGSPSVSADPAKQFGKYVRTEKLGAGGMGEVWKALDTELNRWVALKFLKDDEPSSAARFQREARTAASLAHSGIAAIHEVGHADGRHFIAMQYVQGRTMAAFPRKDRRLLVRLFRDAARALDHAHRHGIIHRDLKPDNLMVEEREDGWHVVILDFGLARPLEGGEKLSQSGEVYGTAAYMSPEQARGEHLDERADVYSLGAAMYEVLAGRPPFRGANLLEVLRKVGSDPPVKPRKVNPRIHRDLETIIEKCLEKDPDRRYANARELADDLERFLNSDPILARPPSTFYRLRMTLSKRKAVAITAACGLIGIAAVAILILGGHDRQKEARDRAGVHVDLARLKLDQMEQLMKVEEDRDREIELLAGTVRAELTEALRICPEHEEACFELGRVSTLRYQDQKALEYFTRAIALSPRQAKAYLARAVVNLDFYERLRHIIGTGGAREETEKSKRVLAQIHEDLQRVRSISTDVPQLKYAAGMISFAQGDHVKAAERLREYVAVAPTDVDGWLWLGHAQGHADAFAEAIQSLTRALKFRPRLPGAHVLRGNAYSDLNRYEEAIADYTRAIELEPKDAVAYMNRGNVKSFKGQCDEAIADFNKALELRPGFANAYNSRGNAKSIKGLHGEAMADFTLAIQFNPSDARAFFNRGNANRRMGLEDAAIADYTRAVELAPKDPRAWAGRADSKKAKGLYAEALDDYARAIEVGPKYAIAYFNRGTAKRDQGLFAEAIADYDLAIALDPKMSAAWFNRAGCKKVLWRLDEALADLETCVQLEPKNPTSYVNRGAVRFDKGQVDDAIADYSKAIELNPDEELALTNRAGARFALGLLDDALADSSKAVRLYPKAEHGYLVRSIVWRAMGKHDESIADCRKAIELNPGCSDAYNNLATAKRDLGFPDEALALYVKAIDLDPKSALAYSNRGFLKLEMQRYEEAVADLEKSLQVATPAFPFREQVVEELQTRESRPAFDEARRLHRLQRFRESIKLYVPIVERHPKNRLGITAAFNIACGYALLGEKKDALDWLEKSVDLGWKDHVHSLRDTDLESLRDDERFLRLVDRMRSASKSARANPMRP